MPTYGGFCSDLELLEFSIVLAWIGPEFAPVDFESVDQQMTWTGPTAALSATRVGPFRYYVYLTEFTSSAQRGLQLPTWFRRFLEYSGVRLESLD
jgi:hypothetical protein